MFLVESHPVCQLRSSEIRNESLNGLVRVNESSVIEASCTIRLWGNWVPNMQWNTQRRTCSDGPKRNAWQHNYNVCRSNRDKLDSEEWTLVHHLHNQVHGRVQAGLEGWNWINISSRLFSCVVFPKYFHYTGWVLKISFVNLMCILQINYVFSIHCWIVIIILNSFHLLDNWINCNYVITEMKCTTKSPGRSRF